MRPWLKSIGIVLSITCSASILADVLAWMIRHHPRFLIYSFLGVVFALVVGLVRQYQE